MNSEELDDSRNTFLRSVRRAQVAILELEPQPASAALTEDDDATLQRLATLPPLDYDRVRKDEAEKLKIRTETLDREVDARRPRDEKEAGSGRALTLPDIEPWPASVDGAALLAEMVSTIRRHVSLPRHAAEAVALWCVWSYVIDQFDIAPRLAVLSPEKRCGKTTLLEIIACLVPRPLLCSGITPSAIFRTIEAAKPTLLIDEADTFTKESEELRGILNSGHTRASATIVRTVGDSFEPRSFSTWSPMILAAIGPLPGTVEDRSIVIPMQRKAPGERVAPFPRSGKRAAGLRSELHTLARKIKRWTDDRASTFADAEPTIPDGLHDRAADNWRPLLSIAEGAGGEWPERARAAATALSGGGATDSESVKVQLLSDIKNIFETNGGDRIGSQALCDALAVLEERPWSDWKKGKPINANQLARMLKPFGVSSRTVRLAGDDRAKGYLKPDLDDAFSRYLPLPPLENQLSKRDNVTTRSGIDENPLFQSVTPSPCHGSKNARIPAPAAECHAVTDQNQEIEGEKGKAGAEDAGEAGLFDEPEPAPSPAEEEEFFEVEDAG